MESLLPLKQFLISRSFVTAPDAPSRTSPAKNPPPPASGGIGDASLRGAHKESRHWKFNAYVNPTMQRSSCTALRDSGTDTLVMIRPSRPLLWHTMLWLATAGHLTVLKPSGNTSKACGSMTLD